MTTWKLGGSGTGVLAQLAEALADDDRIAFLNKSDTTTAPADADGSNQWASFGTLAQYVIGQLPGLPATMFGVKGDGGTYTTQLAAAVAEALGSPEGTAIIDLPPGDIGIDDVIACSSATLSASGVGVVFRGHSAGTKLIKQFNGDPMLYWQGNGGSDGNPTVFGGLDNVFLEGGSTTGGLVKLSSAQQMFFDRFRLNGSADTVLDLETSEDCFFQKFTSNSAGAAASPLVKIYGSADGTSNMLWFSQVRLEDFGGKAIEISAPSAQRASNGGNNGFFFSQLKVETARAHADLITADSFTQQLSLRDVFLAADAFASGFSAPVNGIVYGDGTDSAGFNQLRLDNVAMFGASTVRSVLKVDGTNLAGSIRADNVLCYDTPSVGLLDVANVTSDLALSGDAFPRVRPLTEAATITADASFGEEFRVTLTANRTIGVPAGGQDGKRIILVINPSTHTVTWASAINWGAAGAPTLTASKDNFIGLVYNAFFDEWRGFPVGLGF